MLFSHANTSFTSLVMDYKSILSVIIHLVWQVQGLLDSPVVSIKNGTISGTILVTRRGRNVLAFRGIPYAKTPTGLLRFKGPEPAESWNDTFYADNDPEQCPQINEDGDVEGSEDCLKLNVYAPKINADNLLPVMAYIHGGEFVRGSASSIDLGPNYLLDHDIILVVMQYRLGVFGFLSTGDEVAPGNFGLKDQVLALRWIQENIRSFGGDPERVTLFGQSAGSVSVNLHVLSSLTKGLFHQFIAQSGSALAPWAFSDSTYKDYAFKLGINFNCSTNTSGELIDCLREIDTKNLVEDISIFPELRRLITSTWLPTREPNVDGAFITKIPIERILSHEMQDLPNISGVVKDEGLVLTIMLYANETLYESLVGDLDSFFDYVVASYVTDDSAETLAQDIKTFYFDGIDPKNKSQVLEKLTEFFTDIAFLFPQILQLQLSTKKLSSPHYYYSFEYRGTYSKTFHTLRKNTDIGITHGDELTYQFPDHDYVLLPNATLSDNDHRMIDIITELWSSFAINGIPETSYADNPHLWQPYDDKNNLHLQIGSLSDPKIRIQNHLADARMHFWAMQMLKIIFWSG